jgi:ELWxxDGT repeat protein
LFSADDGVHGRELWKSDGSQTGTRLVKDIVPGDQSASPSQVTSVGPAVFFEAYTDAHGWELWVSDGTPAGTHLVKDIHPGMNWSEPYELTAVNGRLFFRADDGVHGYELWVSDGTSDGTRLVKDIRPGSYGSGPRQLIDVDGVLFFRADDGVHGRELWKSDGTPEGTLLVKDFNPDGDMWMSMGHPVVMNGVLYFGMGHLWRSDGTDAGTVRIPGDFEWVEFLAVSNDTLFFGASNDTYGRELWKSDGTPEGTAMVKDIRSPGSGSPVHMIDVGGTLFFQADDGVHSRELWTSDGTPEGTIMVKDINPNSGCDSDGNNPGLGSEPCTAFTHGWEVYPQAVFAGRLWFRADDGSHSAELWTSDGTPEGTFLVKDINPLTTCDEYGEDPGSGAFACESDLGFYPFTRYQDTLFVIADDGTHGHELWALSIEFSNAIHLPYVSLLTFHD